MLDIDVADTEDVARIVDLWVALAESQRTYDSHISGEPNRTPIRESILRHVAGDTLLVARRDRIVGFVMFSVEEGSFEQELTRGLIENLYVAPAARDEGIGSTLLSRAERRLDQRGVDVVALNVMARNEAARRFYRRHGYDPHRLEVEKSLTSPE